MLIYCAPCLQVKSFTSAHGNVIVLTYIVYCVLSNVVSVSWDGHIETSQQRNGIGHHFIPICQLRRLCEAQ